MPNQHMYRCGLLREFPLPLYLKAHVGAYEKEVDDRVLRRFLWSVELGSTGVLVGLASVVPVGRVGIPAVRLWPPVVLKSCGKVKSLIREAPYGERTVMPDVRRHDPPARRP